MHIAGDVNAPNYILLKGLITMAKSLKTVVATLLLLTSAAAYSCGDKPEKPALPDAATAVTPQMIKAKNDVQAYIAAAEAYLKCGLPTKQHNAMVDEMKAVADDFNQVIRDFKARMAG